MSGVLLWVVGPKGNAASLFNLEPRTSKKQRRPRLYPRVRVVSVVSAISSSVASPSRSSVERVYEVVVKQAALVRKQRQEKAPDVRKPEEAQGLTGGDLLNEAYERCGEVCGEYAKTFYLGTLLSSLCVCGGTFSC